MTDRRTIANIHWQSKLERGAGTAPAGIVTDYADIEQEIRTIIMTPLGSVPTNPLKGCDLLPLIDLPGEQAAPLAAQRIYDALVLWVQRIEVGTVSVQPVAIHHWRVLVPWRVKDDVLAEFQTAEFDLDFTKDI